MTGLFAQGLKVRLGQASLRSAKKILLHAKEKCKGTPLKPLRVDSALRALSTLRALRGAPEVPPLCLETQSLGQHMLERWEQMGYGVYDYDKKIIDHIHYSVFIKECIS